MKPTKAQCAAANGGFGSFAIYKLTAMKNSLLTSLVGVLLFTGAGCTSGRYNESDEAKVVARIIASTTAASLAFNDRDSAQRILSSLNTSESFTFGVVQDAQKKVFASYFRPDQISEKEKFLARVTQSTSSDESETLIADHGHVIAIVPVKMNGQVMGYVAIGRKRL